MEKQVVADDYQRMSDLQNGSKGQSDHETARSARQVSARQVKKQKWKQERNAKGSLKRQMLREWYELGVLTTWYDNSDRESA